MSIQWCQFEEIKPLVWRCRRCQSVIPCKRKPRQLCLAGTKPPSDEAAPDAPTATTRVLADVLALPELERDEATVRKLLVECEKCALYDKRTGCESGHECRRWNLWVHRLAHGSCTAGWREILNPVDPPSATVAP